MKVLRRLGAMPRRGIAGPIVALDLRDMYLKDITLFGNSWDEPVFAALVGYIEQGEIRAAGPQLPADRYRCGRTEEIIWQLRSDPPEASP